MFYRALIVLLLVVPLYGYVDFDTAMKAEQYAHVIREMWSDAFYSCFKKQYVKVSSSVNAGMLRIPHIIHQIWLGSPFPEKFKKFQETIRRLHPDWEYYLWTDENVKLLQLHNQDLFDAAKNYGEKSDILRYELLHRYGGVYLDVDIACVKPLTILHQSFDFYVGLQPLDTNYVQLGIGVLACKPGHWLMAEAVQGLRFTRRVKKIIQRTGPYYFTKIVSWYLRHTKHQTVDVILPATYFYPMGYTQTKVAESMWLKPESFTIHYWAGSWR